MKQTFFLIPLVFLSLSLLAQKKPLDHTVYDGWQSTGERLLSRDGKWVVYTITPQEGDADLYVQPAGSTVAAYKVPRGYNARITEDSRFVVFRIRPFYKETREARIKKKKPEEMPKDSIGIIELGKEGLTRIARVKSYKVPEKAGGWLAIHREREPVASRAAATPTQRTVDSLRRKLDSLSLLVTELKNLKAGNRDLADADEDPAAGGAAAEGSDLLLRNLSTGKEHLFRNVADYYFNDYGQKLVLKLARSARDSASVNAVVLYDLKKARLDTLLRGGNDFKNFALSEDGTKVAFVAERDTNSKALQKFWGLYLYKSGDDSAALLVDKHTAGMSLGMTVSEFAPLSFSKSGRRLLFGTAPLPVPKDTSLIDIDLVRVDIWNYKDDYLQTQQIFQLNNELRRSYQAYYDLRANKLEQVGSPALPTVIPTNEGDGDYFLVITDTGRRVESQWSGRTRRDVYAFDTRTGKLLPIRRNHAGQVYASPGGSYILLYDPATKQYSAWDGKGLRNITAKIPTPLYNEENDVPDDPSPYGLMAWQAGDSAVYIYDHYDVWNVDPAGNRAPVRLTDGRKEKLEYRYVRMNEDERFLGTDRPFYFRVQNEATKKNGLYEARFATPQKLQLKALRPADEHAYTVFIKAKDAPQFLVSMESYTASPDLYTGRMTAADNSLQALTKLTGLNAQQAGYNWGTAELVHWKTIDGQPAEGILYKPEDFDPAKKYPVLIYFYERLSETLYNYTAPAPTPSRLNIPFFVSRGYLVLAPDIRYTRGHPGKDAYNYIVSGARSLMKHPWVDGRNIGIQGQSWGGYQVAYLVTATNLFKAAWAGAPVVNMFSAYGGIRWESGNNRQFQYEKGQSRIGATPWERPDLYIENSPFFHLKNVTTPLVIMSNDADGAVPWYQGIEFFTAMRRLGKKVWLLNYNGEAHNLVERRNRKDIQVREQQYFDWLLKGEQPARWLTEGVPAVKKGREWGLD